MLTATQAAQERLEDFRARLNRAAGALADLRDEQVGDEAVRLDGKRLAILSVLDHASTFGAVGEGEGWESAVGAWLEAKVSEADPAGSA